MTTIATDGRVMAADGRVTAGNEIRTETYQKVEELPDGSVVGCSGDMADCKLARRELYDAEAERRDPEPKSGEYTMMRLYPSGAIRLYAGNLVNSYFVDPPFTIGSGADFARGALAAGASPRKALAIAHKYDWATGPLNTYVRPSGLHR